jgi:threonine/homoserine/homoserine lactone efflux protein
MSSPAFIRIASSRSTASRGLLATVLTWLFSLVVIVGLLMFSVVAAGVLLVGGAVFLGYLWWKTRALRRALRERGAMPQATSAAHSPFGTGRAAANDDGMTLEGEVIREVPEDEAGRTPRD